MSTSAPPRLHPPVAPSGRGPVCPTTRPTSRAYGGSTGSPTRPIPTRLDRLVLPARWQARLAGLAALLVLLTGAVGVLSGVMPVDHGRLRTVAAVLTLPGASAAAAGSVVLGVVLVLLARGLRRRQRRAWTIAVPLLGAALALHLAKGLDVCAATLCAGTILALSVTRGQFRAAPDPDPRTRPWRAAAGLSTTSVAVGWLLLQLNHAAIVGHPSSATRLRHVLLGLLGIPGPLVLSGDRANDLIPTTLGALGLLTLAVPLLLALRPAPGRVGLTAEQTGAIRTLLAARQDGDSLGYFALRGDKALLLSRTGKAAVSYRVESGVALASADPLGDPEAWPGAIAAFLDYTDSQGWIPAVLGCSHRGGQAWARAGFKVLEMGDEAVVDTGPYSLSGRAMRGVRQAVNRVERAGYTSRVRRVAELTGDEVRELTSAAGRWRDGAVERGFSMALGRLGAPGDGQCVVVTAERDGQLQALLHFVPWGVDGWSLDLMRRAPGTDNGVNELLIHAALQVAPGHGVRRVSLNFAVFRGALEQGARLGAGPVGRTWRRVLLLASRFWQIDSLYRFNDKFGPQWQPRYVCFRRYGELPRVALAGLQAEAFLPRPHLPRPHLPRPHLPGRPAFQLHRLRRSPTAPEASVPVAGSRHRQG